MTLAQIVTLALQAAKCPGFTSQAGFVTNSILSELAQTYDFDSAYAFTTFNFTTAAIAVDATYTAQLQPGCGPYALPTDYLRADPEDVFWVNQGVPYVLISVDPAEYDKLVQQSGNQSPPTYYTTVVISGRRYMLVWPGSSGAFPVFVRYRRLPADTATPETSTANAWFPLDTYMWTRLAGEMMKISGDTRWQAFLGNGPEGAQGILDRYLKIKDDGSTRAKTVKLDRRRFGPNWNQLRNTKTIGW